MLQNGYIGIEKSGMYMCMCVCECVCVCVCVPAFMCLLCVCLCQILIFSQILTEYVGMDPGCLCVCVCNLFSSKGWADFDETFYK